MLRAALHVPLRPCSRLDGLHRHVERDVPTLIMSFDLVMLSQRAAMHVPLLRSRFEGCNGHIERDVTA